jgi:signal recognition particle subunit SRP72
VSQDAASFWQDKTFGFLAVYCLYRLEDNKKALALVQTYKVGEEGTDEVGERVAHLKAQLQFRLANYADARDCLGTLQQEQELEGEAKSNLVAAHTLAETANTALTSDVIDQASTTDSYELKYNVACALIQASRMDEAQELLLSAREMCVDDLTEHGYEEADIEREAAMIDTQLVYVQQKIGVPGEGKEALHKHDLQLVERYNAILRCKPEPAVAAVAASNLVAIRGVHDLFDSARRIRATCTPEVLAKMTPQFRQNVDLTNCLLQVHMNKNPQDSLPHVDGFLKKHPGSPHRVLLKAALLLKEKKVDECSLLLQAEKKKSAGSVSNSTLLAMAHVALLNGNNAQAIEVLKEMNEYAQSPAMIATLVAMHKASGEADMAQEILDRAVAHYSSGAESAFTGFPILREAAIEKLRNGQYEEAATAIRQVLEHASEDLEAKNRMELSGLAVVACSFYDIDLAEEHMQSLPNFEYDDIDPTQLEDSALKQRTVSARVRRLAPADKQQRKVERKKSTMNREKVLKIRARRKEKYMQELYAREDNDYNEKNPPPNPDPERWIPKKHRSSALKRRGKNRNKFQGAQGGGSGAALEKEALKLDAYARAQNKKDNPNADVKRGQVVTSGPARNAKKKKGRK